MCVLHYSIAYTEQWYGPTDVSDKVLVSATLKLLHSLTPSALGCLHL